MSSVAGNGTESLIEQILEKNGIDPEEITDNGQTAFQRVEAAIGSVLDEID